MKRENKVIDLKGLAEILKAARSENKTKAVVHCHGVFDLLHVGHIRHFEQARKMGDLLVVTVTPDRFVNKGTHRPTFPEALRAEAISALEVVDYVAINNWPTAVETIQLLRPDVYCKGAEFRKKHVDAETNMLPEIAAAGEVGTRVEYTDDIAFSSSELLNRHFTPFPPETDAWLNGFRKKYKAEKILEYLDGVSSLKAMVVGEAIIDEYVFCQAIGKSTKDPMLACQYISTESFLGGSLAVANHLAGFCDDVALITCLGDEERREDFIRDALLPNVRANFVTKKRAPTIHKRRFVDKYSENKLLELYLMEATPLSEEEENEMMEKLDLALNEYDVVIAADYGHGMLTESAVETLCDKASFLVVNTQSNAGNRGFNHISKYRCADYVCLAGYEIMLETRSQDGDPRNMLAEVAKRIQCKRFTGTYGKRGSLHYDINHGFTEVPALATKVADRVGAGDAVLALTSLLVKQGVPWDVVGFVGNVAGAQMVNELGNRVSINKVALAKHIISLLK